MDHEPSGCGCSRCGGTDARNAWLLRRRLMARRDLIAIERPGAAARVIQPEEGWTVPEGRTVKREPASCERAPYDPLWCRTHHADYGDGRPACEARRVVARIRPRSAWAPPASLDGQTYG